MRFRYISVLLSLGLANILFASDRVPVRDLFEKDEVYEGQKVTITGEVIGDIMRDGRTTWVNINDGDFLIGVAIFDESLLAKIKKTGRYRVQGDMVRISGVYHIHCGEHLGERDIHVETLDILSEGYELEDSLNIYEVVISLILAIATLFFVLLSPRRNVQKDTGGQQN